MNVKIKDCKFGVVYNNHDFDGCFTVMFEKQGNYTCCYMTLGTDGIDEQLRTFLKLKEEPMRITGFARLANGDTYDEFYGKVLAFKRAYFKYAKLKHDFCMTIAKSLTESKRKYATEVAKASKSMSFFTELEENTKEKIMHSNMGTYDDINLSLDSMMGL